MAAQQPQFHSRTGSLIILSNNNRTAQRNHPAQEFNNGVVLSAEPLRDNVIFEVCIVKKVQMIAVSRKDFCHLLLTTSLALLIQVLNNQIFCTV